MKYLKEFTVILGFCLLGELLHYLLPLPVPASVYGLVLMLLSLMCGIVKLSQVETTADYLIAVMSPMFLPAATGMMEQFETLRAIALPFFTIVFVGLVAALAATGRVAQWLLGREKEDKK